MYDGLRQLSLNNFRSHENFLLKCDARNIIITGANGAGKTNILEAISMLSVGKGFRGSQMAEQLRNFEGAIANYWAIRADFGSHNLVTAFDSTNNLKRIIKIDEELLAKQADIVGYLSVIWFLPSQAHLFQAGTSDRRKYFDRIVYSFDAQHARRISAYEHYMRERGRLLKSAHYDKIWLEAIEAKIAQYSLDVAHARIAALEMLAGAMNCLDEIFPKAKLNLFGMAEQGLLEGNSQIEAEILQQLEQSRALDKRSGRCSVGAHKTQLQVIFCENGRAAEICSTGEQKAILLSILLAQIKALQDIRNNQLNRPPIILLLDEMVAHLDESRRQSLFSLINAAQIQLFATGTDYASFARLGDAIHVSL